MNGIGKAPCDDTLIQERDLEGGRLAGAGARQRRGIEFRR